MAEKTVVVRLVALTGQYKAAMAQATAATGRATAAVGGRTTGGLLGAMSGPAGIVGAAALAGGVVAKMAFDYDEAFTRIAAVTNQSQHQVEQWREEVLQLAGRTAQAPEELAKGLYFLASSGLETAEIMPTLEASAKAAAVGLGEMSDITRIAINAMNAFPEAGLTATEVMDTLVAAVREGVAEPQEFAEALGRVLPIANKAGVEFDELVASLSTLSLIGLDVNEGVTAMRGLLNAIVAPGTQAAETIEAVGLSTDELRRSLAEDGLIATLNLLEGATGGDIEVMRKIVPNIRAMTGAFGLTGQEAEKVDGIFRRVADATGSLGTSFEKTSEQEGFKLRQALAELSAVAIELGDEILPTIVDALTAIAAVAGPTVNAIDDIVGGLLDLAKFKLPGSSEAAETAVEAWDKMRVAIATGAVSVEDMRESIARAFGDEATRSILSHAGSWGAWDQEISEVSHHVQLAGLAAAGYSGNLGNLAGAAEEAGGAAEDHADAEEKVNREMREAADLAERLAGALDRLAGAHLREEEAALSYVQGIADMVEELKDGTKTLDINTQAGRDNRSAILSAVQAAIDHGAAIAEETGSLNKGKQAVRNHVNALIDEAVKAGLSEQAVRDYIRQLNLTPKQIETLIRAKTEDAKADVARFKSALDSIPDIKDVLVRFRSSGNVPGGAVGHAGGTIGALHARRMHGGGPLRGDEQWFIGQRGEEVLSVREAREWRLLRSMLTAPAVRETSAPASRSGLQVAVRLDRRRFTDEYDHDVTYAGRWS